MIDRVLHQAVVYELEPHYARSYIAHSYACLPGRGPQRALLCYLGRTRRYAFRLALDIRRYFMSVHHETLMQHVIFPRLRDAQTRALLRSLILAGGAAYCSPFAIEALGLAAAPLPPGSGLPIGSSLSQWAANLYLDGLDHFVQRKLKVPAYQRYMDDLTLFSNDADQLYEARNEIVRWLHTQRRLELNPKCWEVCPAAQPSTYLGYRVSRAGVTPGRKMRRRMRGKVVRAAARGGASLTECLRSYRALVSFG